MGAGRTVEDWDAWTGAMRERHGNGNGHGKSLGIEALRLLPTPRATDGSKGGPNQRNGRGEVDSLPGLAPLLPTPTAVMAPRNNRDEEQLVGRIDFGAYTGAVRRWEQATRPAPPPTANGRLSPRFVEWMMGLPEGWVTDVPGLSRTSQLKILGNGVVPQQAVRALIEIGGRA
jgi:DNA (cytosine-5)-methyltransferase 1